MKEKLTSKQKEVVDFLDGFTNGIIQREDGELRIGWIEVFEPKESINQHTFEALLRKGLIEPCAWRLKGTE